MAKLCTSLNPTVKYIYIYRKLPAISPGLIQLRKGAYKRRRLYPGAWGRGLKAELKKRFQTSQRSVDRNTFLS